jgi:hypothetical protein
MESTHPKLPPVASGGDGRIENRPSTKADDTPSTEVTLQEKQLLTDSSVLKNDVNNVGIHRKVPRELLVNRLNLTHFQDDCIQVCFTHRRCDRSLLVQAFPQPSLDGVLECRWAHSAEMTAVLQSFDFAYILVRRGQRFIQAFPAVIEINTEGARLALPDVSHEVCHRKVERQRCRGITVGVIQDSVSFAGQLLDFNAFSFRIELEATPPQSFEWIETDLPVNVVLFRDAQTFFSGECRITRSAEGAGIRSYVMEPLKQEIHRYEKAEIRSQRQELTPSPNLIFQHPLTGRRVDLKVIDLSGSGFSVEEDEHAAVLMPGLILPEVELWFANSFKLTCCVQVVFRRTPDSEGTARVVRCGLALMDMPAPDHVKLLAMLHQSKDRNAYICNELDLEALWDFLFETGFIYPTKYALIHKDKERIKETYEKLYTRNPQIARHFVYQRNGLILGHMAMIRFWQNTWLIHHHAARKSALNKAGLAVLNQISQFTHDTFRFRSLHMDFLVCYYRPQNKFPHRIFGGFAQSLKNPKACSIDPFAYLQLPGLSEAGATLPDGWQLLPATDKDLSDLNDFYNRISGGLMLKAFDLEPNNWQNDAVEREYAELGFKRKRRLYAVTHHGRLKALMVASASDLGLNLSDLTHCIHAFVLDREGLAPGIFTTCLQLAARSAGIDHVVALVYPEAYPRENAMPIDKTYHLWAFHVYGAGQAYLKYLSRLTRHL